MSLAKRAQKRKAAGVKFDFAARAAERAADPGAQAADAGTAPGEEAATGPVRRVSVAQRHRHRIIAAAGSRVLAAAGVAAPARADNDDGAPMSPEEAQIRLQLIDHLRSLKQIQSREAKIALKRDILPAYDGWCQGVVAADSGAPDVVLTTALIWRIDVGDYFAALPLIEYVLRHKLDLPEQINRTAATFITEEIAEAAIKAFDAGGDAAAAFPAGILAAIEDLVDDEDPDFRADMPDEVRAKLQKAIGRAVLFADKDDRTRQEETLKRYLRALELDPKAGVKKQIETLQRQLRPQPPAPQGEG